MAENITDNKNVGAEKKRGGVRIASATHIRRRITAAKAVKEA